MCVALDREQAVAGYINTHPDGHEFTIENVNEYIMSLWNAGCGPVRLNFTQPELKSCLDACRGICLSSTAPFYKIDKTLLDADNLTEAERAALGNDRDTIRSFVLFCRLHVDTRTPDRLLEAMGFKFMYRD